MRIKAMIIRTTIKVTNMKTEMRFRLNLSKRTQRKTRKRKRKPQQNNLNSNINLNKSRKKHSKVENDAEFYKILEQYNPNVCQFRACRDSVKTLGRICTFCNEKFCFSHIIPEIHGCGEAAKSKARADWMKQHQQSSVPKEKEVTKERRPVLQQVLRNKINKENEKRQKKKQTQKR